MRRFLFAWTLVLAVPAMVFAASGAGSSSSGATGTGALVQARAESLDASLADHAAWEAPPVLSDAKSAEWSVDIDRYKDRSTQLRTECQGQIQRANRDTLMQAATACVRGDLMMEIAFLQQERTYIASVPGITQSIESGALMAIDNLTSADQTVASAIDAKLYTQIDQLKDVKQKLTATYRTPLWLALLQVQADRNLTWLHYILKSMNVVLADGSNTDLIDESAASALSCMAQSETGLRAVVAETDLAKAGSGYTVAQKSLTDCWTRLWSVAHLKERLETPETATGSSASSAR
jgi:hypothetical protein